MKRMQHEESSPEKSETWMQHEKSEKREARRKREKWKNSYTLKSATRKRCKMENVQNEENMKG